MTSWKDYETFFKYNIVWVISNTDPASKEPQVILNPKKKGIFVESETNEKDLEKALGLFLVSLTEEIHAPSERKCHGLPKITKTSGDKEVVKTWTELFSERTTTRFGIKSNNDEIDARTWKIMENIYNYWKDRSEATIESDKLGYDLKKRISTYQREDEVRNLLQKDPELKSKIEGWLDNYDKLSNNEKASKYKDYKYYKETYDTLISLPDENDTNYNTSGKSLLDAMKEWDLGKWALYVGGVLFVMVIATFLIKKLFQK